MSSAAQAQTTAEKPLLDTLADIECFEQTLLEEQFPAVNAYQLLQESAQRFGDDPALELLLSGEADEQPSTTSFRELFANVTRTANLLHTLGVGKSDTVSILLPLLPQTHAAILGGQTAGIVNPVNPMLEARHIGEIVAAADARVIICLAPSAHTDLWQKLEEILPELPELHTVIAVHQPGLTEDRTPAPDGNVRVVDYASEIRSMPEDRLLSERSPEADEPAAYFHTGGTTGRPKLACLTHGNMAFLGQLMRVYTAHMERQTVICGLPLFHIYGVIIQGVAAFAVGYRIILLTPAGFRNPRAMQNFWRIVERFGVNSFATVPTVLSGLNQIPLDGADISSLTRINSGAAPLSPSFEQQFEERFDLAVSNGYGMTETTALITRPPEEQPSGSVGMRLPYSQIRIAELEGDRIRRDCGTGEPGVVLVRGPQIFAGYKAETDNRHARVDGGWFNTGDLGYLDEQGFLYLTGRAKDLIIRSGHNIDPALIEEPLSAHESVASAVAVGQPDPYAGELPMAWVMLKPGAECTQDELLSYCQERISERAAIPRRIEFIDEMPLTAVGKTFRPALRHRISELVLSEHLQQERIEASVEVRQDERKGMLASVWVDDPGEQQRAQELLNAYPLPIEVLEREGESA